MNNAISPNPSFLLLHFLLLSIIFRPIQADLITQTCQQTPNLDLCVTTLRSNPQSSDAKDVKDLARVIIDSCLAKATDTLNFIRDLIKQNRDEKLETILANCAELYIPVVKFTLPQAIDAFSNGRYAFAKDGISDAGKEADSCEKGISSYDSPVSDRNKLIRNLSDVATAIVDILING